MRALLACLGVLGLCVSAGLADGRTLQTVSTPKLAVPTKIAKLAPDGALTEWIEYGGTRQGCDHVLVFD